MPAKKPQVIRTPGLNLALLHENGEVVLIDYDDPNAAEYVARHDSIGMYQLAPDKLALVEEAERKRPSNEEEESSKRHISSQLLLDEAVHGFSAVMADGTRIDPKNISIQDGQHPAPSPDKDMFDLLWKKGEEAAAVNQPLSLEAAARRLIEVVKYFQSNDILVEGWQDGTIALTDVNRDSDSYEDSVLVNPRDYDGPES